MENFSDGSECINSKGLVERVVASGGVVFVDFESEHVEQSKCEGCEGIRCPSS